uniref:Uncharacterized protein n=1 Tax=Rhizophora mucronata TaxID=61149 RepID=A0A2P2IR30_RHIMU
MHHIRGLQLEKTTYEATTCHLRQDIAAHKMHTQTLAIRLEQVRFEVERKCELKICVWNLEFCRQAFLTYVTLKSSLTILAGNLEIQDLKDCLLVEQEEKNELNKKFRDLEKERKYIMHSNYALICACVFPRYKVYLLF